VTLAEVLKLLIDGVALFLSVVAIVFAWARTRRREDEEGWQEVHGRLDAADTRLAALSARLDAAPTSADLSALKVAFAELHGDLKALSRSIDAQTDMVRRLEAALTLQQEHLLKGAGR